MNVASVGPAPRHGYVGILMEAGEQVLTRTDRLTTPFPRVDLSSNRRATNTIKRIEVWLMDNARQEASACGNDLAERMFSVTGRPSDSDKAGAEHYLFPVASA